MLQDQVNQHKLLPFVTIQSSRGSEAKYQPETCKPQSAAYEGVFDFTNVVQSNCQAYSFDDFQVFQDFDDCDDEDANEDIGVSGYADILAWLRAVISLSPVTSGLWYKAAEKGWSLGASDLKGRHFHLDVPQKTLFLDHHNMRASVLAASPYFLNELLADFVRGLRDIWHEELSGAFDKDYNPEKTLMLERVRSADCDTVLILAAWELRGAEQPDLWRHLIGSETGDMALAFSRYLERDPASLFNGRALSVAFRQWYADEQRVNDCDHSTLEMLDDLALSQESREIFGSRRLTSQKVQCLSLLPDGMCYLEDCVEAITQDPIFFDMTDPINQSHLFHLMHDLEVSTRAGVPFRDKRLANRIFPEWSQTTH